MPAQSVASPATINPVVAATPAAPVRAREDSPGADQFGRDLVAARTQQEKPAAPAAASKKDNSATTDAATKPADGAPSTSAKNPSASTGAESSGADKGASTAAAATETPTTDVALPPGTADATGADPASERAEHDQDGTDDKSSNANGMPQFALGSLFPFVSAASPATTAQGGAFASSAGVGAHGAAAVASSIADAAKMLLASAANAQKGGDTTDGPVTSATGLASLLDAAQSQSADGTQAAGTSAAGLGTAPLPPLPAPAAGTHLLAVAAPVGSDGFNQDLAGQVTWLASQDIKQARIRVHPEDLGPVDLKVTMSHDHVDVVFSVQHPGTMQVLQQSLPQLGQMLAQHGLSLGHAEVGQHGGNNPSTHHQGGSSTALDDSTDLPATSIGGVTSAPNLLDAFA